MVTADPTQTPAPTPVKPGYLTTEFWATFATSVAGAMAVFGPDAQAISGGVRDAIVAVAGAAIVVYTLARSVVKVKAGK
jgi:hypothetical protein